MINKVFSYKKGKTVIQSSVNDKDAKRLAYINMCSYWLFRIIIALSASKTIWVIIDLAIRAG